VLQNSLKSPFLHSQILCNFLGIFPQIFLPPESFYSISNPILLQKSIKIYFSFYSFGFQPEQQFQPGLLPPFPAQPWPTSSLPFRPSRPVASPSLTGGSTLSVNPAVFHLPLEPPLPVRSVAAAPRAAVHPPPALGWSWIKPPPGRLPSPALARRPIDSPPRINVETDEFKTHRRRPPPTPHLTSHDPIKGAAQPFATFLIGSLSSELRVRGKKPPPICFSAVGHPPLPHRPLKPWVSFASLPSPSFPSRGELSETEATGGESSGEPLSGAAVRPPWTVARLLVHHSVSPAHQFF
jgi:hypothetical protein